MDGAFSRFTYLALTILVVVLSLYVEVWHGKLPFISNADFVDSRDLPVFMTGYSSDDRLKKKTVKIAEGLLAGPETVVFEPGTRNLFTFTSEGVVSSISEAGEVRTFIDLNEQFEGTRPLGASFAMEGDGEDKVPYLYIADAVQGLVRVSMDKKVELVSTEANGRPIRYANDVDVDPRTGYIYFTDSTDIAPSAIRKGNAVLYDTLGASIHDLLRGRRTGRLLRYDPASRKTIEIANDMWFANGVSLSRDGSQILVCETFAARILAIPISTGGVYGAPVAWSEDPLPGYCDGINHSNSGRHVLVSAPSPPPGIALALKSLPSWMSYVLRCFLVALPASLSPKPVKAGIVVVMDARNGKNVDVIADPKGDTINMVSSVTEDVKESGRLLLGTLTGDFVGAMMSDYKL